MIYKEITEGEFVDSFKAVRPDNFSYEGLRSLYDYLLNISEETEENIELDVIAICCDFSEVTIDEVVSNYSIIDKSEIKKGPDGDPYYDDEQIEEIRDFLEKSTIVVDFCEDEDRVIIQDF